MQENADNLAKEVEKMYTPLSVAKEEIWRRWNDKELRKKVNDYLGNDMPNFFKKEPKAIIVRQIASPNIELSCFLELAKTIELKPVINEYAHDKFVSINSYKLSLGKLSFFEKMNKNKSPILRHKVIINIDEAENKRFKHIKTLGGEKLIDFHHKMLKFSFPCLNSNSLIDISNWCETNGGKAENYYGPFLAWFISNGILFENFIANKNEGRFTEKIVIPAFKKIEKEFKLKPLIVPIINGDDAEQIFWRCYDSKIEKEFL